MNYRMTKRTKTTSQTKTKKVRDLRNVSFGKKDADLVEFLEDKGKFSTYIKNLLREEIVRQKNIETTDAVEKKQLKNDIAEILGILRGGNVTLTPSVDGKADSTDTNENKEKNEKAKKKRNKFGKMLMESMTVDDEEIM